MTSVGVTPLGAGDALPPPPSETGASALRDAAALLWPAPARVEVVPRRAPVAAGERVVRDYLLVPGAQRPRLVLPTGSRRAAAAIARRRGDSGQGSRLLPAAAALATRAGVLTLAAGHRLRVTLPEGARRDDVERELAKVLGQEVAVGLTVGSPRVNRKPILHVLDRRGTTLAFVKVGHTESARRLVRTEAASLAHLAAHALPLLEVPRVIDLLTWRGLDLLVLTPVGGDRRTVDWSRAPYAAMRELAAMGTPDAAGAGASNARPLATSVHFAGLRTLVDALANEQAQARLDAALTRVLALAGATPVAFGAWHGDWTPWNMTQLSGERVAVWDWERFGANVPVGFDALHYLLQSLLQQHGTTARTERAFLDGAATAAVAGGALDGTGAIVTALYVAELAGRYLSLLESPEGAPLARRSAWIVPLLETCAARI